jgi:hypothetical protein
MHDHKKKKYGNMERLTYDSYVTSVWLAEIKWEASTFTPWEEAHRFFYLP